MARRPSKSRKPREPRDIIQTNLRLRVEDHAWLVEQAKDHRQSLNAEIAARVMHTREQHVLLNFSQLMETASRLIRPYEIEAYERVSYAGVMNACERIINLVKPLLAAHLISGGHGAEEIRAAIDRYQIARRALEFEAGKKIINRGHDGGGS